MDTTTPRELQYQVTRTAVKRNVLILPILVLNPAASEVSRRRERRDKLVLSPTNTPVPWQESQSLQV